MAGPGVGKTACARFHCLVLPSHCYSIKGMLLTARAGERSGAPKVNCKRSNSIKPARMSGVSLKG